METLIYTIQIVLSITLFVNKVLMLIGRRSAWIMGLVGTLSAIAFFILTEMFVFTTLEIGLSLLMIYGLFAHGKTPSQSLRNIINVITIIAMIAVTIMGFQGFYTIMELTASLLMIGGIYLLANGLTNILGWVILGASHIGFVIVAYDKNQEFFAHFQIASAIVCLIGAYHYYYYKKRGSP